MLKVYYAVIFITGLCSLSYQVIWQRYLSILVGAEARSGALVVSVFLFGLATGYYYFGKLTSTVKDRRELLKRYGVIELITSLFIILFPTLFNFLFNSSLGHINNFLSHSLLTMSLCFIPAFLMGATVPVMTKVLPRSEEDVNKGHAQVYGVNTLGAFIGVLLTGLFIVPEFGLKFSLILFGILNFLVSFIYIGNNLDGEILKKTEGEKLDNRFKEKELYALAFVAGLVSLGLEILWFRLFSFAIGSSFIVFPLVLSLFILGIGLGSLTLKDESENGFKKTLLFSCLFSALLFILSPLIPLIISHLRVSIVSREGTFWFYHGLIFIIMGFFIFPSVFYLGRLLPYSYSMLKKDTDNYGMKCGWMYLYNTLGAVLGSIVIGYFFLYIFDLDTIYRLLLAILLVISLHFLFKFKKKTSFGTCLTLLIIVLLVPFPRKNMWLGLFRIRDYAEVHSRNILDETYKIKDPTEYLFKDDGPNSSVAAAVLVNHDLKPGKAIFVNGKSDSHTVGDFPTLTLLGLIPYFLTKEKNINTSLIGIGTGVTAGILSKIDEVKKLDVIEISPSVIDSIEHFSPENYDFDKSSKVSIFEMDAFQYYKASKDSFYDFIVSEPTNPWVNGVENLYTPYFYDLVARKIKEEGVFVQWIHSYSMDKKILSSIFRNMNSSFPNMKVYRIKGDLIVVGSKRATGLSFVDKKLNSYVHDVFKKLGLRSAKDINYLEALSSREVKAFISTVSSHPHDLFFPSIGFYAYKNMFLGKGVKVELVLNSSFVRVIQTSSDLLRKSDIINLIANSECSIEKSPTYFCKNLILKLLPKFRELGSEDFVKSINAYGYLRRMRFIAFDQKFFDKKVEQILNKKKHQDAKTLIFELLKEGQLKQAKELLSTFISKGLISTRDGRHTLNKIENTGKFQKSALSLLR